MRTFPMFCADTRDDLTQAAASGVDMFYRTANARRDTAYRLMRYRRISDLEAFRLVPTDARELIAFLDLFAGADRRSAA